LQPVEYLGAYSDIETSSHLTTDMQLVVTMGDFAKTHFQSTLDETETLQTSRPTAFSKFVGDTYLTPSATYNRSEMSYQGQRIDILQLFGMMLAKRQTSTWIAPHQYYAVPRGLLERALD